MRAYLRTLLVAMVLMFALTGCANPIAGLLITRSAKEKEIATLKADYEAKIGTARQEATFAKDKVIASKDAQMVGAAGALYGQQVVFQSILTPTRTDLLQRNLSQEAWSALGNVPPTPEALKAMNERLAKELDATKTSLADLQTSHAVALAQNALLAEQTKKHETEMAAATARLTAVESKAAADISAKQTELLATQDKVIAAEKASADGAKARQAQLAKLSWGAGILAALCLAGAIWSPVAKSQLAMGAIVLGGAALAIPFVTGWIILIAVGLGLAALTGWVLVKHHKEERIGDALSLAMQDLKEKGGELAATVESTVSDRLARYTKVGGKLVTVPDTALQATIDAKLASYDHLPANPVT